MPHQIGKWIALVAVLALGIMLVGYGTLSLSASEMTSQDRLIGWAMVLAGFACGVFVLSNLQSTIRRTR